jgi:hypothetical protein
MYRGIGVECLEAISSAWYGELNTFVDDTDDAYHSR